MQCSVPGGQTSGVFSVHAVVVTILFKCCPRKAAAPHSRGGAACSEREQWTRGEDEGHVGTLSISVHEEKENAAQTLLPGASEHQEVAEPPGDRKSPDHS